MFNHSIETVPVYIQDDYSPTYDQLYLEELKGKLPIFLTYHAQNRIESRNVSMRDVNNVLENFSWRHRTGSSMEESMTYFYVYGINCPNNESLIVVTGETVTSIKVISVFRRDYNTNKYFDNVR